MRVLQSIGQHQGLPTAFYYCRTAAGVKIVQIRGELAEKETTIKRDDWQSILDMIANSEFRTFAVTDRHDNPNAPNQNLYAELTKVLKGKVEGLNDSLLAYITSVLVHEGTLELYHGVLGDREARIVLRKSS